MAVMLASTADRPQLSTTDDPDLPHEPGDVMGTPPGA